MNYINYLDLPKVPDYLIEQAECILSKPKTSTVTNKDFFQIKQATDELRQWCLDNLTGVPFEFRAHYQIIGHGIPIHRDGRSDGSVPRTLAINYVLNTGGENVTTAIYNDDKEIIESVAIEAHRWHSIRVDMLHCVLGLTPSNFRIAISLAPVL